MKDSLEEALMLSDRYDSVVLPALRLFVLFIYLYPSCHQNRVIQGIISQITGCIGVLYKASEAVSVTFVVPVERTPSKVPTQHRFRYWTSSGPSPTSPSVSISFKLTFSLQVDDGYICGCIVNRYGTS